MICVRPSPAEQQLSREYFNTSPLQRYPRDTCQGDISEACEAANRAGDRGEARAL